jgi:hypothetical protein
MWLRMPCRHLVRCVCVCVCVCVCLCVCWGQGGAAGGVGVGVGVGGIPFTPALRQRRMHQLGLSLSLFDCIYLSLLTPALHLPYTCLAPAAPRSLGWTCFTPDLHLLYTIFTTVSAGPPTSPSSAAPPSPLSREPPPPLPPPQPPTPPPPESDGAFVARGVFRRPRSALVTVEAPGFGPRADLFFNVKAHF